MRLTFISKTKTRRIHLRTKGSPPHTISAMNTTDLCCFWKDSRTLPERGPGGWILIKSLSHMKRRNTKLAPPPTLTAPLYFLFFSFQRVWVVQIAMKYESGFFYFTHRDIFYFYSQGFLIIFQPNNIHCFLILHHDCLRNFFFFNHRIIHLSKTKRNSQS